MITNIIIIRYTNII